MKILIIDGQGGKLGALAVTEVKERIPHAEIIAVGTNSTATAAMLKAGAENGATGENPVVVCAANADIIIAPIAAVIADSLLGEVTPKMACAVGSSHAQKILIPSNRCSNFVVGVNAMTMAEYVKLAVDRAVMLAFD